MEFKGKRVMGYYVELPELGMAWLPKLVLFMSKTNINQGKPLTNLQSRLITHYVGHIHRLEKMDDAQPGL